MPVPSFLASIADKAQSAINHLPSTSHPRPTSPDSAAQPPANETAAQSAHKSHTLEAIQYQLRALGQQYSSTTPVQRIITAEKGVALDFDSIGRDSKAQSKELYTWGQTEAEDLKDVTDRLAYLNFVHGSLATTLSSKLDVGRTPIKTLRDAESVLIPRRNFRAGLQVQIGRFEHDQQRNSEKRVAELRDQLRSAELEDQPQERELEILKRKAVRESEVLKWEAIREYGEKLVLLSQASAPIIAALPIVPPTAASPYLGAQATGTARASLQRALDNYKTGHISLPSQVSGANLSRSDTVSFGESHASELSSINSEPLHSKLPDTPPTVTQPLAAQIAPQQSYQSPGVTPINPSSLNIAPTPIPNLPTVATPPPPPVTGSPSHPVPPVPTIAETGHPVVAGGDGPGPAKGSLHDLNKSTPATLTPIPMTATADADYISTPTILVNPITEPGRTSASAQAVGPAKYESAEEEKRRLEREEREHLLRGDGGQTTETNDKKDKNDDLPPYQEI